MPVTADDIKTLVIAEVGDTPDQLVASSWSTIWESYADKADVWPRLQELYSKRRAINMLLARVRTDVDFTIAAALHGSTSITLSQRTKNLRAMLEEVQAEITAEETKAQKYRPAIVEQLTRTEIEVSPEIEPVLTPPDANSPLFRGDPYMPSGHGGGGTVGPI